MAYLRKGEYDVAIRAFDEAISLRPDYGEAFANRAAAYLKKQEYDRAARDFDEAIRIAPGLRSVWHGRCWTRAILGALQGALEDCAKALQSEPESAAAYDSRGLIYLKMGQLAAAIDRFNAAQTGTSQRVERVLLLQDMPSIDEGAITDKGYINQRATLDRRRALVDKLYAGGDGVIEIA